MTIIPKPNIYNNSSAGCGTCDIDSRDDNNSTPAHKAAGNGQLRVMKWLLDHDGDLTAQNNDGETPKEVAKRFGK